jgi:hypothetical protein
MLADKYNYLNKTSSVSSVLELQVNAGAAGEGFKRLANNMI